MNLRRLSQQIYSLPHLTTLETPQSENGVDKKYGLFPENPQSFHLYKKNKILARGFVRIDEFIGCFFR